MFKIVFICLFSHLSCVLWPHRPAYQASLSFVRSRSFAQIHPLSWWCLYLLKSYRFQDLVRMRFCPISLATSYSYLLWTPTIQICSSLSSFFLSHSLTSQRPVYLSASLSLLDLRDSDDTNNCRNNQHHSELLPQSVLRKACDFSISATHWALSPLSAEIK